MPQPSRDSQLAIQAAKVILDGRDPVADRAQVLITLDHLIASVLLVTMEGNARHAVEMFTEGTVPHVEERIMMFENQMADHERRVNRWRK